MLNLDLENYNFNQINANFQSEKFVFYWKITKMVVQYNQSWIWRILSYIYWQENVPVLLLIPRNWYILLIYIIKKLLYKVKKYQILSMSGKNNEKGGSFHEKYSGQLHFNVQFKIAQRKDVSVWGGVIWWACHIRSNWSGQL